MNKIDEILHEKKNASWSRSTKKKRAILKQKTSIDQNQKWKKENKKKEHDRSLIGMREKQALIGIDQKSREKNRN